MRWFPQKAPFPPTRRRESKTRDPLLSVALHHAARPSNGGGDRGIAIVIVLVFIVLLTGLVVAYFSRAIADRQLSNSSLNQAKADDLARSVLAITTANLKQELVSSGSAANTEVMPVRNGEPQSSGTYPIPTLLRVSTSGTAPGLVDYMASNAISTATSANGRSVSLARWNQHYLIPLVSASTGSTPVGNFTPPSWVYLTGTGPTPALASPTNSVIARYAYAIYDESALLDVNTAGYPCVSGTVPPYVSGSTQQAQYAGKGALAFADLTALGLSGSNVNGILGWRNYATLSGSSGVNIGVFPSFANLTGTNGSTPALNYYNAVESNTTGFLQVSGGASSGTTDQAFLTRQELLKLCASLGISGSACQYLGTFSRAVNAPSWSPTINCSNGYLYKANAESTTMTITGTSGSVIMPNPNRDMVSLHFTTAATVTHYDDLGNPATYNANLGDPLLQSRFSLARIAWLSQANPDKGTGPAPSSTYGKAIQSCFGLTWGVVGSANGGNACWSYVGSSGSAFNGTIETLDMVAAEGREPNFFELLKAAILAGSVGQYPGQAAFHNGNPPGFDYKGYAASTYAGSDGIYAYSFDRAGTIPAPARISDIHIMQIGANIISQYSADSYPTAIYFHYKYPSSSTQLAALYDAVTDIYGQTDMVYGDENLPCLVGMYIPCCTVDGLPLATGTTAGLADWWQPVIWNPHQMPNPANTSVLPPSSFQINGYGQARVGWGITGGASGASTPQTFDGNQYIKITDTAPTTSAFYAGPILLTQNTVPNVTATTSLPQMMANSSMKDYSANPFVGFWAGSDPSYPGTTYSFVNVSAEAGPVDSFCMGWVDSGGGFHPYSYLTGLFAYTYAVVNNGPAHSGTGASASMGDVDPNAISGEGHVFVDARTNRFSSLCLWQVADYKTAVQTFFPCYNPGYQWIGGRHVDSSGWGKPGGANFVWDTSSGYGYYDVDWEVNSPSPLVQTLAGPTYYSDPDGVVRPGDGQYGNDATGDGMMLFTGTNARPGYTTQYGFGKPTPATGFTFAKGDSGGNTQHGRRPLILNRPFRSVGELGYTFRDLPFKSLDFFSSSSGDAALLDVFCVKGMARIGGNQLVTVSAGEINPNNAPYPVLQAILAGGSKKDFDPTYNIGVEAKQIAQNIASQLNSAGASPIASRSDLVLQLSGTMKAGFTSSPDIGNKEYLEGPVRALADVTNTRTWNLMIDVIAQTGNFTPNATDLNGNFVVQGERRYWLHVAIDRYTGKVIDQQLEPVYE